MWSKNNYGRRIREKGQDLVADLGDFREIVKEAVGAKVNSVKEGAGNTLASIRDGAASMARNAGESATAVVRKFPWKSMACAATAGMLVAWYFRRR